MRCGFSFASIFRRISIYKATRSTFFEKWASKAGLTTTSDRFGDIYGLDDEVSYSIVTFHCYYTLISYLRRAVVGFCSSTSKGRDFTLPAHRRFQKGARCPIRQKIGKVWRGSHRSPDYLDQTDRTSGIHLFVLVPIYVNSLNDFIFCLDRLGTRAGLWQCYML